MSIDILNATLYIRQLNVQRILYLNTAKVDHSLCYIYNNSFVAIRYILRYIRLIINAFYRIVYNRGRELHRDNICEYDGISVYYY